MFSYLIRVCCTLAGLMLPICGCSGGPLKSEPSNSPPRQVVLVADWNDLEAAAEVAVPHVEMAVLEIQPSPQRVRFELLTATDEPGELIATRAEPATDYDPGEQIEITLTARIGRFGDAAHEVLLLDAMRTRLLQLKGVATAPLQW